MAHDNLDSGLLIGRDARHFALQNPQSLTVNAEADARVMEASPDTNDGTLSRLDVDSPGEESYIRFTVTGATGTTVTAVYSGPNQGQVSGVTGDNGEVVLRTDRVRNPQGVWCFEVTDVSKDGYVYNPNANVVTIQCESN